MNTRTLRRQGIAATITAAALLAVAACGSGSTTTSPSASRRPGGTLRILAAASLTEAFTAIGKQFEAENSNAMITLSFGGSSAIASQINSGSPADVFASASPTNMATVTAAGNADGTPVTFARNQLVIAVAKGNPHHIGGLADLTKPGLKVVECAAEVPCGAAATKALTSANIHLTPVSLEQDVKSALSKVKLGEADAALVYRTDTLAAKTSVDTVEFPESSAAINTYPIVVLSKSKNAPLAHAFVTFVTSPEGQKILTAAGFLAP